MALGFQVITSLEELSPLVEEWRLLAVRRGNAFVTPEWLFAWLRHYDDRASPFVITVRSGDGELAGIVPLVLSTRRRSGWLSFAGANLGDYFHPVCAPGDERAVIRAAAAALATHKCDWSAVVLHNVDQASPWPGDLVRHAPIALAAVHDQPQVLPYIDLGDHTWSTYLATRSRNFRGQLNRKLHRIEREHDVRFRRTSDPGSLDRDIATFFRFHDLRWDERGGSSVSTERARAALRDFAAAALQRDWLRLWFLDLDGEAVAAWYGWQIGGRYVYYLAGFDPVWSRHSVGLILLAYTIRDAFETGATEYDMLLGNEEYKARFATGKRTVRTVVITRSMHPSRAVAALDMGLRRAGRLLPSRLRDPVRATVGRVLERLPSSRER